MKKLSAVLIIFLHLFYIEGVYAASSCAGYCGGSAGSCWCDSACTGYGDCCSDYQQMCAETGNVDVFDFWRKSDPIYASNQSGQNNFDAQFKIKNNTSSNIIVDDMAIAIIKDGSLLFDCWRKYSATFINSNSSYSTGKKYCEIWNSGNYTVEARLKMNGQWSTHESLSFNVIDQNSAPLSSSVDSFVQNTKGKCIDMDGAYGCQCVDLMHFYIQNVLGIPRSDHNIRGNAYPIYSGLGSSTTISSGSKSVRLDKIPNTPSGVPQKGDIVFWSSNVGGGKGHVSIFINGNVNSFTSLDQNWVNANSSHGSKATVVTHNYNNVVGWLHPVVLSPSSFQAGESCGSGMVYDCSLKCVDESTAESWSKDAVCDDGSYGMVLTCPAFNNDSGACN